MIPIVFLFIILECNASGDLSSRASDFSIELVRSTGLDNVVIATFSLWSLMASLSFWATGEFKEQIFNVLRLPRNTTVFLNEYSILERTIFDEKSNSVNISSKIFVLANAQYKLYPEFKKTMMTHFRAVIETINTEYNEETARVADDFIFKHMNSIFNIFQPEDFVNTTMIMSSVIKFESQFKSKFNVSESTIEKYYYNNDTYLVLMMHQTLKLPYSNIPSLDADAMELELGDDGKFSLLLIVPNLPTNMKKVYNKLNTVTLKDVFDKLQSDVDKFGLKEVYLKLPKVKINTKIVLNKPLSNIGLKHILEPEKSEFSEIISDDLYISTIDHACEILIGETGVHAIASTPGYRDYNNFGSDLEAEQPFIFFVMEKTTQTIMFGGIYSKPLYIMI